ncbi:hypothetical protein VNO77_01068 [Canavalia gladiata]|uniref:Transmembrane protein n=1 Tax=Canavalia gladiata TaxID=3824 RepID=A0AAN9MVV4_CANGL
MTEGAQRKNRRRVTTSPAGRGHPCHFLIRIRRVRKESVVVLFESLLLEEQNPLSPKTQTLGGCETRCVLSFPLPLFLSLLLGFLNSSIWGLNPRFRFGFRGSISRFCIC